METGYLRNGEEVIVHKALDDNEYIIERTYTYESYKGQVKKDPCGVRMVVSELFKNPLIKEKRNLLINIIKKIEIKNSELKKVENQLIKIKNEIRKNEKYKTVANQITKAIEEELKEQIK